MNIYQQKPLYLIAILLTSCFTGACSGPTGTNQAPTPAVNLGTTIGSLTELFSVDQIPVEGYNLVGGLKATGSPQCPPELRVYLEKYILQRLPKANIDKLISSNNTAVVHIKGIIPPPVAKNQRFDVIVTALPGTQTTSLVGGRLWGANLYEKGRFTTALKPLAKVEGPVFIDTISPAKVDQKTGYILAGATVLNEYKISLALKNRTIKL